MSYARALTDASRALRTLALRECTASNRYARPEHGRRARLARVAFHYALSRVRAARGPATVLCRGRAALR